MATATVTGVAQSSALSPTGQRLDIARVAFVTDDGDSGSVNVPYTGDWPAAAQDAVGSDLAGYTLIRQAIAGVDSIGASSRYLPNGVDQPIVVVHVATDDGFSFNVQTAKTGDWPATLVALARQQLAGYQQLTGA